MKRTYLFGILATSLIAGSLVQIPTFAASYSYHTTVITSTPTKAELEQAIAEVKALPGYTTYGANMDNFTREQSTPLFREYRYLAELVTVADRMIADYEYQPAEALQDMLLAAKDAVIACRLIFANANPTSISASTPTTTASAVNAEVTYYPGNDIETYPDYVDFSSMEDTSEITPSLETTAEPAANDTAAPSFDLVSASKAAAEIATANSEKSVASPNNILDQSITNFAITSTVLPTSHSL